MTAPTSPLAVVLAVMVAISVSLLRWAKQQGWW